MILYSDYSAMVQGEETQPEQLQAGQPETDQPQNEQPHQPQAQTEPETQQQTQLPLHQQPQQQIQQQPGTVTVLAPIPALPVIHYVNAETLEITTIPKMEKIDSTFTDPLTAATAVLNESENTMDKNDKSGKYDDSSVFYQIAEYLQTIWLAYLTFPVNLRLLHLVKRTCWFWWCCFVTGSCW